MKKIPDISRLSPDETKKLLEQSTKPLLCHAAWDMLELRQSRVTTDENLVSEYRESMENGDELPPSKGIFVHSRNKCALFDGIHTATARNNLGQSHIPVLLQLGTATDADMAAAGANFSNGARRSNADKRNAIKILIRNSELACLSNNRLATIAKVSALLVEEVRVELENDPVNPVSRPKKRRVSRNGSEYEIDAPAARTSSPQEPGIMDSEKLVKRAVAYLAKLLSTRPTEEHANVCGMVIAAIRQGYSLE